MISKGEMVDMERLKVREGRVLGWVEVK